MSIEDRDYYRADSGPRWSLGAFPVKWTLIGATGVAFVIQSAIENGSPFEGERFVRSHLALSLRGVLAGEVWQPLTYLLLHGGITHILWNMIALYVFATVLEDKLTPIEQWRLYLVGGLGGAAGCLLWSVAGLPGGDAPVVGASGAVTALLVGATLRAPFSPMVLLVFPVPLWLVAVLFLGTDLARGVIGILDPASMGDVAVQAHLGGGLAGAVAWQLGRVAGGRRRPRRVGAACPECGRSIASPGAACRSCGPGEDSAPAPDAGRERVDALLERIHAAGIGSLSEEEREFLKRASERYRSRKG